MKKVRNKTKYLALVMVTIAQLWCSVAGAAPQFFTSSNYTVTTGSPSPVPSPSSSTIPCQVGTIVCATFDAYTVSTTCLGSGCVDCSQGPVGTAYDLDGTGRCSCTDQVHYYRGPGCTGSPDLWTYRTCTGPGGYNNCSAASPSPSSTPGVSPSPGSGSPFPSATPCHLLGDPHMGVDCNTCQANYVRVARPFPAPPMPAGTPFRVQSLVWAKLQSQIRYAQERRDYRFIQMLQPMIDAICPSAQAAVCSSGETCEKDIFNFCTTAVGGPDCTTTTTYANGGTTPPGAVGCTTVPLTCSVAVTCHAWAQAPTQWASDSTNFKRHCTVNDTCFTGDPQTCAPFNRFPYAISDVAASLDGNQLTSVINNADQMCIPDCERFDGTGFSATASGLSYVWAGSNVGACACAQGYVFNTATKKCTSPTLLTGCDSGTATSPPSPVSPEVTGADYAARFNNTRNKKMACCLNGLENNAAMAKFDCVENSGTALTDFNTLWASSDTAFGGQMNAIELTGANGKPVTGWYSMGGKRADQFSEFSNTAIQPGIINAKTDPGQVMKVSGTQQNIGSALTMPSGAAWTAMITARQSAVPVLTTSIPTTIDDKLKYPLLVRAAAVYTCPKNAPAGVKTPLRQVTTGGLVICPVATSVAIHLRVEQIWQIAGTPNFKTIDTVLDRSQMSGVSIDQIMGDKYGPGCAPGTFQQGDACAH